MKFADTPNSLRKMFVKHQNFSYKTDFLCSFFRNNDANTIKSFKYL